MASPFSVFRKNQKVMIAVLGVLAMFAFVFIPIIMEGMGSRTVVNPVVVKTSKYGDLREYDLDALRRQRQQILGVLSDVMQISGAPPSLARQWLEARIGPATEESVVNTWLLARHAEQMGMVISDKTINNFLKELTQDLVKPANFQTSFKRSGISELHFFNAMRDELAALQLDNMFRVSLRGVTPAQRWEYFTRVKQMATIEAAPVLVANYLDRIDEPSDEELKAFFEKHKDQYPLPISPEPGFREPQKIAMEYLKADYEKFTAPNVVADEEIKARYEKNKDLYDQPAKKPEEKKEEKPSAKDTKDTKESKEAAGQDAVEKKESKESKDAKETEESDKEKESKDTSAVSRPSPFILTALLQGEKPVEKPSTADKAATGGRAPEASPAEKPSAATQEKPAEPKPGLSEATKDRIRREIAYEKIQKIFERLREQMDDYRRQWSQYEVAVIQARNQKQDQQGEVKLPPAPRRPDFEKLAKENGLSAGRTDLISQWEAQSLEIGTSLVGSRDPVWHYGFLTLAKFRPEMSVDLKGDLYLFWKTDETKERIPNFDDKGVREQVLRAWKMIPARKLALQEAESFAAEARKTKKFLKQAFADRPDLHVILPPPFSWITFGNVPLGSAPNAARVSTVAGVDMASDDFMRAVFRLEPGQTGAGMNAPQTVAYVIRLTELNPAQEVLWKQFEVDDFSKYAPAAEGDRLRIARAWLDEIKSSAGFELAPGRKFDRMVDSGSHEEE